MPTFQHKGNEINYTRTGEGQDLVFLHGLAADARQSEQAMADLPGIRLIAVDMPGHGRSPLSSTNDLNAQVSFRAYTEVVCALLTHLGITNVIAGGISMGAGIALSLALAEPQMVRALLLVRPAWLDRPGRPQLNVIEDIGNWIVGKGPDEGARLLLSHPVYADALVHNPNCAASVMGAVTRPQATEAAAVLPAMVADQPFARIELLQKCTTPALVIGNNADPLHPAMIARETSGALANSEYFHAPPRYLEPQAHQAAVLDSIRKFLDQHL